jgi:hypothetical protein
MFWNRIPLTPSNKRQMVFAYRAWMVFAWGIFPLTLVAVYVASFFGISHDPRFAQGLPLAPVLILAAIFVAMMALFFFMGIFARGQIRAIEEGRAPWPWSLSGGEQ